MHNCKDCLVIGWIPSNCDHSVNGNRHISQLSLFPPLFSASAALSASLYSVCTCTTTHLVRPLCQENWAVLRVQVNFVLSPAVYSLPSVNPHPSASNPSIKFQIIMVKRQQSSGNLLPKRSVPFDHGITAAFLLIFSSFGLAIGGTMTGLSYAYEKRNGFTSVAESYNLRCDIAGPVLLASGGVGLLLALVLISVFGVCSQPEWSSCEAAPPVPSVSHGVEIHAEGNNSKAGGRRTY